jgi:hypothetical protein
MIYECDQCNNPLPPDVTECPHCGDKFDEPVPSDAEIPKRGFTAKAVEPEAAVPTEASVPTEELAAPAASPQVAARATTFPPKLVLGLVGSVVLFLGTFAPIVSLPIVGSMNYVQNGNGDGIFIIAFAVISLVIVLRRRYEGLWFTGACSLGVLSFTFMHFNALVANATSSLNTTLADNPFKGIGTAMMQTVQIQWGFAVLVVAALLLIAAAAIPEPMPLASDDAKPVKRNKLIPAISAITFLVIFGASFAYTQNEKAVAAAKAKADADAVAAQAQAEQAAQAQEQQAAAAAEADRQDAVNKLSLPNSAWGFSSDSNEFASYIVGKVRNDSGHTFSYLRVNFDLLDSHGNKIGTAEDTINDLAPGQTWKFRAMAVAQNIGTAQFAGFEGDAE